MQWFGHILLQPESKPNKQTLCSVLCHGLHYHFGKKHKTWTRKIRRASGHSVGPRCPTMEKRMGRHSNRARPQLPVWSATIRDIHRRRLWCKCKRSLWFCTGKSVGYGWNQMQTRQNNQLPLLGCSILVDFVTYVLTWPFDACFVIPMN